MFFLFYLNLNDTKEFECCSARLPESACRIAKWWCWMDSSFLNICAILKWIIRSKDPSVQISCPQDRVAKVQKQLKALEQWRCSAHLSACWSFFYILIVIWESSQWKAWYIYIYRIEHNTIYIYIHIMTIRTWTFISMGMFCVFQQCMLPVVQIWGRCRR